MRYLLALVCGVTIAASAVLALSYVAFKGTGDLRPLLALAIFVGLSAANLAAWTPPRSAAWTMIPAAAGAAIIWVGVKAISQTLNAPHFEGYALVMGALGVVQGILALLVTGSRLWAPAAAPYP